MMQITMTLENGVIHPFEQNLFFCDEVNRLLKYIPFEIVLTRSGNNSHCYFGAANTAIDFGNDESG